MKTGGRTNTTDVLLPCGRSSSSSSIYHLRVCVTVCLPEPRLRENPTVFETFKTCTQFWIQLYYKIQKDKS